MITDYAQRPAADGCGSDLAERIEAAQRLLREKNVPVAPGFPERTPTLSEAISGIAACI